MRRANINVLVFDLPGGLEAKISDFGLASVLSTSTANNTKTKGVGSVAWMGPEVYEGHYTESSDVWAMGIVMYALLGNALPFEREYSWLRPPDFSGRAWWQARGRYASQPHPAP